MEIIQGILNGMRVYMQDSERGGYYIVIPPDQIKKYVRFSGFIIIKKGDLLTPTKWINHLSSKDIDAIYPVETFDSDEIEYVFMPFQRMARELKQLLSKYAIEIDEEESLLSLLKLSKLPENTETSIRRVIEEESTDVFDYVDVFLYDNIQKCIVLDSDYDDRDIVNEYTDTFLEKTIVNRYVNENESPTHYLLETKATNRYESNVWYHYSPGDTVKSFFVLQELFEIEDLIPFTKFFKLS